MINTSRIPASISVLGVIDHRLVVHRQQLFTHRLGDRMQPCSTAPGQDDALTTRRLSHDISKDGDIPAQERLLQLTAPIKPGEP